MAATKHISDTFIEKLKEQSFTIILLVCILYYQNMLFSKQLDEYKKMIEQKEQLVLKLTDEERLRLIEREKYLVEQRDGFIQDLREEIKNKRN